MMERFDLCQSNAESLANDHQNFGCFADAIGGEDVRVALVVVGGVDGDVAKVAGIFGVSDDAANCTHRMFRCKFLEKKLSIHQFCTRKVSYKI